MQNSKVHFLRKNPYVEKVERNAQTKFIIIVTM